ncbi:MAG: ParB/RepB/Spo0J family partition protein [Saprospiraceae bacterium]|uniref:ParB/RepB/Spo0J family partition protein n=1 Tax=Candidatus Opimibacter skivensis TaxID=2982028 RepID=A0A9D7SR70_9BACT|nr:ParB/RepB/Spo0J family partition protein [Candidatus Opimibacter skivensis]
MQIGKGIRALLTNIEERGTAPTVPELREISRDTLEIPVDAIEINPFQPRKDFDEASLQELAQSIRVHGIIQPLTIRRMSEGSYQLISGERRLRASKLAGLKSVPAYIRLANDQGMLEMAIVENIQREDLNAIEMAFSLQRLIDECKLTHEELSQRVGKQRSTVTNFLRLLKLPPQIQQALRKDDISMGHARSIASLEDISAQLMVLGEIMSKGLSVRDTEKLVSKYLDTSPGKKDKKAKSYKSDASSRKSADLNQIQQQLRSMLGVQVALHYKDNGTGHIQIPFKSDKELNYILDLLEGIDQES